MDTRLYPPSAGERAMKVQEVILRAIDGRLKWYEAAEILGISDRQMRRWKRRYEHGGYDGLWDRRRQRPSPKRVPLETVRQVLTLYRERYRDCHVLHFHEKLQREHGLPLSYTWVKTALQTAGLVATDRRRSPHRTARPRRPLPGMLLHTDASTHAWIPGLEGRQDLIAVLDDATSHAYYARFVPQESTRTMLVALKAVIEQQGVFWDRKWGQATLSDGGDALNSRCSRKSAISGNEKGHFKRGLFRPLSPSVSRSGATPLY